MYTKRKINEAGPVIGATSSIYLTSMVGPQPNHHQRVRQDRVDPKGHVTKASHSTGRPGAMGDILKVQTPVGKKIQIGMKFYGAGGGGGKFTAQVTTVANKKNEKQG